MRLSARSPDRLLASADLVITVGYNPIEFWPALWNAGKDRKIIHIDVREPDLKYAEAFGATGMMIRTPDEIAPTLRKAMATTGPVVIGVHVDYRDNHKLFELVDERSIH